MTPRFVRKSGDLHPIHVSSSKQERKKVWIAWGSLFSDKPNWLSTDQLIWIPFSLFFSFLDTMLRSLFFTFRHVTMLS